jgi:hypothetical protein
MGFAQSENWSHPGNWRHNGHVSDVLLPISWDWDNISLFAADIDRTFLDRREGNRFILQLVLLLLLVRCLSCHGGDEVWLTLLPSLNALSHDPDMSI